MHGFELGGQQNEKLDGELRIRLAQLRAELDDAAEPALRKAILKRIEELKQDYTEQSRRLAKLEHTGEQAAL